MCLCIEYCAISFGSSELRAFKCPAQSFIKFISSSDLGLHSIIYLSALFIYMMLTYPFWPHLRIRSVDGPYTARNIDELGVLEELAIAAIQ